MLPLESAKAEYESIYHYYIEEGLQAFYDENFEDAIFYFKTANAIDPSRPEPVNYLNLIKREKEGLLKNSSRVLKATTSSDTQSPEASNTVADPLVSSVTEQAMYELLQTTPFDPPDERIKQALDHAVIQVKSDTDELLADEQWGKVKAAASEAVIRRVERLKIRGENLYAIPFIEKSDAQPPVLTSVPSPDPLSEVQVALDQPQVVRNNEPVIPKAALPTPVSQKNLPTDPTVPFQPTVPYVPEETSERPSTYTDSTGTVRRFYNNEELKLTDELWTQHRTLTLEIEIGKSVIFAGKNIVRYLSTTQELLEITRIDKDRIRVKAVKRGTTILYIWDDKGRWAFNVRCVYPFENVEEKKRLLSQEMVEPFNLGYNSSWSTLHKGPELGDMTQQNLIFTNWIGIDGQTPYGGFYGSINTYRFPQSTEIVGQRIGLTDGRVGPFKDFTIRGYDSFKGLSDLTLPGRYFRGIALDSYAFHHKLSYSYFRGQDQTISIYSSDGNVRQTESFLEGYSVTLNPDEKSGQYTLNYVRGFGEARDSALKDANYSIETLQRFKDFDIRGEVGYDEDQIATIIRSEKDEKDLNVAINLRDVPPDYKTIYGEPTDSGQVGASVNVSVRPREFRWDTFMDLYRDRAQPSENNPDLLNVDFSTSYSRSINDRSGWGASFGYVNTVQTLSPRQFLSIGSSYSNNIPIGEKRYLSLSLSETLQWSRYGESPTSDYDRLGLRAAMRYKMFKYIFASLSYEYIFVHDVFNSEWNSPSALESGLSLDKSLTDKLSINADLTYRNESQSGGNFSFLAGEDSISKTISLTYRPSEKVSIYLDSQLRHVWPQNSAVNPDYYDWNLMLGLRADWDLPFRWNPTGEIQGIVYKDYNGNSLQDSNEPGMPGIKVIAGRYQTQTNENGEYSIKVSAKKVNVSLDLKTIPKGFVFSTALSRDVTIGHKEKQRVNFGLTSRSGVYGVAFVDLNGNGRPDRGDKFIPNIVLRLETGEITKTDYVGSYFFDNVSPGKHKLKIDVTSIPIAYVPTIKIENEVELEEGMTFVQNIPLKESNPQPAP